jgi:small GTP-binding protein
MMKAGEAKKLHIAIIGRKNVGKSLLINSIASMEHSHNITSDFISRKVQLVSGSPEIVTDFAIIDDETDFDQNKKNPMIEVISTAALALIVLDARTELSQSEVRVITFLQKIKRPFLVAVNKIEFGVSPNLLIELEALEITHFEISCKESAGIESLRKKLIQMLQN